MSDEQVYAFYTDPANLVPAGPAPRRRPHRHTGTNTRSRLVIHGWEAYTGHTRTVYRRDLSGA